MALVQKRNPRRTALLFGVLISVLVAGIATIYLLRPKTGDEQQFGGIRRSVDLPTFTKFSEDLYATEQFKALQDFLTTSPQPETPVAPPGQRNPNPFQTR